MSDETPEPVALGRIVIELQIEPDGTTTHYTEWTDELGFVEGLGLLEAAKDTFVRSHMED